MKRSSYGVLCILPCVRPVIPSDTVASQLGFFFNFIFLFKDRKTSPIMARPSTTLKLYATMFYKKRFSLLAIYTYRTKTAEPTEQRIE